MHNKIFPSVRTGIIGTAIFFSYLSPVFSQTSVLTQHNDNSRTGQNLSETILTPAKVSSGNFGKIFSLPVDGEVLAQPLYVPKLTLGGATHNVVFIATENDSVYAFDADTAVSPLWQASLVATNHGAAAGATTVPVSDSGCANVPGEYGITGTPVIDPASGTLYVVSATFENNYAVQRLHALDILTGNEKFGGPVVITATVTGSGTGSSNNKITFDPRWELQRAGLLLVNGMVYVAFGAHCDLGPFHGWLMAYNAATLAQTSVFITTPNGEGSGIWMGGSGLAVDTQGTETRMFLPIGNGTYDATTPYTTNNSDYGDDILRLNISSGINVDDAFTAKDQASRNSTDTDVGSGGALILPDQPGPYPHLLVQVGKGGSMFLVNRDNLGGYSTTANNIVQEIDNQVTYLWGMPAYWNGNIYLWTAIDALKQFQLSSGLLSQTPVAVGPNVTTTGLGSTPSISANGNSGAIVWVIDWSQHFQVLYAADATNVASTLWSSATNSARDSAGVQVKFPVPTVVNGKVYVGSVNQVMVYGLLPSPNFSLTAGASTVSVTKAASAADTISVTPLNGFSGTVSFSALNLPAGVTAKFSSSSNTSSVVTFAAAGTATAGSYAVTITGTSGALSSSLGLTLIVNAQPGFSLSASPTKVAVQQGASAASSILVSPASAVTGAPVFNVSGLPAGVTATFLPTSSATSSTVVFAAASTTLVGTYSVTVTGTYNSVVATASLTLSVTNGLSGSGVQLINKATGACFDVNSVSKAIGTQIGQSACWGGPNQLWNLAPISASVYQLISVNSGLSLDISASSTIAGAVAIQDVYNSLNSQQWKFQTTSDGYFNLINGKSSQCLDGVESSVTLGYETQQQVCSAVDSQKWSLVPLSKNVSVNLSPFYNKYAISVNGVPTLNGGADGGGNAFSSLTVGSGYSWYGQSFVLGPPSAPDAVTSTTVALPAGQYSRLFYLAFAVNGTKTNQTFIVNYSDGTSTTVRQSLSDWQTPAQYAGEQIVLTVPYRLVANGGLDSRPFNIYGYKIILDSTKTVVSVTLPNNLDVIIMAMTLGN